MVELADLLPQPITTDRQLRDQAAQQELRQSQNRPGALEAVGLAIQSEWVGSFALRQAELSEFDPDPQFELTQDLVRELGKDLPDDLLSQFSSATSLPHAVAIRDQVRELSVARERLASLGWTGGALRIAALVLDPVAIAASVFAEGIAAPAIYGAKLTRLQRFVRSGMVFGAVEAGIEGALTAADPERDANDILYAGLGGFLIGGGINVLRRGGASTEEIVRRFGPGAANFDDPAFSAKFNEFIGDFAKEIELTEIFDGNLKLTEKGTRFFANQLSDQKTVKRLNGLLKGLDLTDDEIAALDPKEVLSGLLRSKRASLEPPPPPRGVITEEALQFDGVPMDGPVSQFGKVRIDMVGQIKQSDVPLVRRLGHMLAEDPFPNVDGTPNLFSASEFVTLGSRVREAEFERAVLGSFDDWAKRNGVRLFNRAAKDKEFMEQVTKAVRRAPGELTDDKSINAVADALRKQQADLLGMLKRTGVTGFSDVPESATYVMRITSQTKLDAAITRFGLKPVTRMIRNSLLSGSEDLTEKQADQLAQAWLGHNLHARFQTDISKAQLFGADHTDSLRRVLKEQLGKNISDADIEELVSKTKPRTGGTSPRARRRMDLDETFREELFDDAGQKLGDLGIEDLLENNARRLNRAYARQALGEVAMRKVLDSFAEEGQEAPATFAALVRRLERQAQEVGANPKKFNDQVNKLNVLNRAVLGLPLGGDDTAADVMRWLRAYNYLRVGGQFGFAQIPELGQLLHNPRTFMRQVPAMRQIWSRAKNGEMNNSTIRELEHLFAGGTDLLRDHPVSRFDDLATSVVGIGRFDEALQKSQRFVSQASFMAPVNMALQRSAALVSTQKWFDLAKSGRKMSKKRLATMALTPDQAERIYTQIRKHGTGVKGTFGRRADRLNLSAWTDQEAASNFTVAMFKWSRRAIQENDIGNLSKWMTTDLGRMFVQFRSFVAVAWSKQFLFNLSMRDWESFSGVAFSTVFGGSVYIAQQYANSIGRPDQDKFLRQRLTPEAIAAAAFQRSGFGSIAPPIVDSLTAGLGFDPVFSFGRTSQLSSDAFLGNPTTDLINRAQRSVRGLASPITTGEPFTQNDARTLFRVLPFSNILGARNMLETFIQELPRR